MPYIGTATATSCHAGSMKMQGANWYIGEGGKICTGDKLIASMREIEGGDVTVYWLRGNDGNMLKALVYRQNRYICEAVPAPRPPRAALDRTPEMLEAQAEFNRYRSTVQGYQNESKRGIDRVMVVNNAPLTFGNSFAHTATVRKPTQDYDMPEVLPDIEDEAVLVPVTNTHGYAGTELITRF